MASVPNFGLLNNAASGIREAMIQYQSMKNNDRVAKLQEMAAGVQPGENGEYQFTPQKQQEIDFQNQMHSHQLNEAQRSEREEDPASAESQAARGILQSYAGGKYQIPESISATQAKNYMGLIGTGLKNDAMMTALGARTNMQGQRLDLQKQGMGLRQANAQGQAGARYSKQMTGTEDQLMAANRVADLTSKISAKDLQSTPQLRSDLSAALSTMLSGGKPATVYGMSHQDFDSLYGRAQKAQQFLTGDTGDSMTEPQLAQLTKDVNALRSEYGRQHQVKFKSFEQSESPMFTPGLESRYQTFRSGAGVDQGQDQSGASGLLKSPGGAQQDPDAVKYSQMHNLPYPQAKAIMDARKAGQ